MGTPAPHPLGQAVAATAGPGEPVPVAFLGRTSTATLQDPVASLGRQLRNCRAWLPAGWQIVACYWDVESGGIDLEARSQGRAWEPAAAAAIPRDGGITDLLTEARSPMPSFAVVVCEDIERSARDTFNSLKLERNSTIRASRCSPPMSPPILTGSTRPRAWSAGSSKASRNGTGCN